MAGSMANAISSEAMVIALGRAGMLRFLWRQEDCLCPGSSRPSGASRTRFRWPLCFQPYSQPARASSGGRYCGALHRARSSRRGGVWLILRSPLIVRYRARGSTLTKAAIWSSGIGSSRRCHGAKLRRSFPDPAPAKLLGALVQQGLVTDRQGSAGCDVPMADDVTVEADSGGHTDNRPLVCLLPSVIAQRDDVQALHQYATPVRIGAAGGIGTPITAFGALMMGAAYVVTGSINHACVGEHL